MATDKGIIAISGMLSAAYPTMSRETNEQLVNRLKIMRDILGDIEDDTLAAGVRQLIADRDSEWCPSVGEIRGAALRLIEHAKGDAEIDAGTAWRQCGQWLSFAIGSYGGAEWRKGYEQHVHLLAIQAIERYGTRRFVRRLEAEEMADFAQFRGIFESLQKRTKETAHMLPSVRDQIAKIAAQLADAKRPQLQGAK